MKKTNENNNADMNINEMTIFEKLQHIQTEMKAPKNLFNSFGNYNYRNAESILEAFKPFGSKYGITLTLVDEIVNIGDRYYVKATANLINNADGNTVSVPAYAREAESKKGMDESQVTGATSSYARKYALNGLFLLDDTKDADTDEYHEEAEKKVATKKEAPKAAPAAPVMASEKQINALKYRAAGFGMTEEEILEELGVESFDEITKQQANQFMDSHKR